MITVEIALLVLLAIVVVQDFRDRKVSIFLFPLLWISSTILSTGTVDFPDLLTRLGLNILLILLNILLLTLYFSIRNRKPVNIMKQHLGYGDLLFFIVPCLLFSPLNFLFFTTASLLLILIGFIPFYLFRRKPVLTIPLAGGQSFLLFFVVFANMLTDHVNLFNDDLISPYLLISSF